MATDQSIADQISSGLTEVQNALEGPSTYLKRVILASIVLYAVGCIASVVLLGLARRLDDFWLFKLRSRYICPHSSFAFLAANAIACGAMTCLGSVALSCLLDPARRLVLEPYAWLGCVWTAPWLAFWLSYCGGICGLFLLPSTPLGFMHSSWVHRFAPIAWNIVLIGMPIAALAVTMPLSVLLSRAATQAYTLVVALLPIFTALEQQLQNNPSSVDVDLLAEAATVQAALSIEASDVKIRWARVFWFWTGFLAISLLVYIPTFLVLIRSLVETGRRVAESQHTSALSSPDADLIPADAFAAEKADIIQEERSLPVRMARKQEVFGFTNETRRKQRSILLRTAILFTSGLVGAAVYFGLLCWLAAIDPIRASQGSSAIAYSIAVLGYAVANLVAVGVIAVRLVFSISRERGQNEHVQHRLLSQHRLPDRTGQDPPTRPTLQVDAVSRRMKRRQDPTLDSPLTPPNTQKAAV